MANYPNSLDSFIVPVSGQKLNSPNHISQHILEDQAIVAIETELGVLPKGSDATVKARLDRIDSSLTSTVPVTRQVNGHALSGDIVISKSDIVLGNVTNDAQVKVSDYSAKGSILVGTGSGTYIAVGVGADTNVLTADSTQTSGVKWAPASGGASVTRNTFTNDSLTAGVLTITHNLGLSAPYPVIVTIFNNSSQQIIPDTITGLTNTCTVDLTSYGTLVGTWGYAIIAG